MKQTVVYLGDKILYSFRNSFILSDPFRRAKKNRVNINYWNKEPNIGDIISPIIVNYLLSLRGLDINKKTNKTIHLYAVGSVLTAGMQDCCVWGSGIGNIIRLNRLKNRNLDIRLLRGPLTGIVLKDMGYSIPNVFGDPAILLKDIYFPRIEKKYKYGFIFHGSEKRQHVLCDNAIYINIINNNYQEFINQLLSCEIIISSTLHGIILAETYGIKSILLQPLTEKMFKYYDWYYSTGRNIFPIAKNINEAIKCSPIDLPDIEKIKSDVINTFPYDLFIEEPQE